MDVFRLTLIFDKNEFIGLNKLSQLECRRIRDQARFIIITELLAKGLLQHEPSDKSVNNLTRSKPRKDV